MKSKFKVSAYLVAALAVFLPALLLSIQIKNGLNPNTPILLFVVICFFFLFIWIWMFFGELRTKVITLNIEHRTFIVKRYLGLGKSKIVDVDEIDGLKISILPSRGGSYEYLYLMVGNKKIAKLSEFYHSNYKELKRYIVSMNIKNDGFERFSNRQEFKDIFS